MTSGGEAGGRAARKAGDIVNSSTDQPSGDLSDATFMTVAEVAQMMRVSKMTVYRLVHNGELPAVRVGRSFRVREEDANEYLRRSYFNAG